MTLERINPVRIEQIQADLDAFEGQRGMMGIDRDEVRELLAFARLGLKAKAFLAEHGEAAFRVLDMAMRSHGFAKDFGGVDSDERKATEAFLALVNEESARALEGSK